MSGENPNRPRPYFNPDMIYPDHMLVTNIDINTRHYVTVDMYVRRSGFQIQVLRGTTLHHAYQFDFGTNGPNVIDIYSPCGNQKYANIVKEWMFN